MIHTRPIPSHHSTECTVQAGHVTRQRFDLTLGSLHGARLNEVLEAPGIAELRGLPSLVHRQQSQVVPFCLEELGFLLVSLHIRVNRAKSDGPPPPERVWLSCGPLHVRINRAKSFLVRLKELGFLLVCLNFRTNQAQPIDHGPKIFNLAIYASGHGS